MGTKYTIKIQSSDKIVINEENNGSGNDLKFDNFTCGRLKARSKYPNRKTMLRFTGETDS